MAVAEFNPDHVLLSEKQDGTFTPKMTNQIMEDVAQDSLVMQLGTYEEMSGEQEKTFTIQTDGLSAYWVDEGKKIQTSKPEYAQVTMRAKKLGVILVVSREFLHYTWTDFFNAHRGQLAEAFYRKIDDAVLLNNDNPFAYSVLQAAENAGHVVDGELNYNSILEAEDLIFDAGNAPSAFVTTNRNHSLLRTSGTNPDNVLESIYDRNSRSIDGLITVESDLLERGQLIAGDWQGNLRYGVPYNINFELSRDAQISTLQDENGEPVNLFERELIALRTTMDFAAMTVKDNAFSVIQPAPTA